MLPLTKYLAVYLAASLLPVALVAAANVLLDPSACWPATVEAWLASRGVFYPGAAITVAYSLTVFYPSMTLATRAAFR